MRRYVVKYTKFRREIEDTHTMSPVERGTIKFDDEGDVDVFLLKLLGKDYKKRSLQDRCMGGITYYPDGYCRSDEHYNVHIKIEQTAHDINRYNDIAEKYDDEIDIDEN